MERTPWHSYGRSVTCHMGSHSVTCHPTQMNTPHLNPSHTGRYSIDLPRKDGRLSWPRWLVTYRDGLPARRRSPIQVLTASMNYIHRSQRANHYSIYACASPNPVQDSSHHIPDPDDADTDLLSFTDPSVHSIKDSSFIRSASANCACLEFSFAKL